MPICAQCRSASTTCIRRRLGSTVDSTDFGGESYVESLKSRIHSLQAQVQEGSNELFDAERIISPTRQLQQANESDRSDSMQYFPSSNHSSTNFQPRNDLQETMQEASYLSLSAMAERTDRQPFPTEGLSFMTLLRAATGISGSNPTRSVGSNASLSGPLADFRQSFFANNKDFKQLNVGGSFQRYMEFLRSSFPFISNNELKLFYENVISCHERDSLDQFNDDSPEQLLLTYIGIATGILLSPDYHYREALAAELSVESLKLMSRVFDHANDLAIVSCMTALTIYSLFTTFGGSTWHLLGLTMMRCISSGMHTTRVSNAQCDNEEKRKSYRIFWVLYILDTYVNSTQKSHQTDFQ